MELKRVDLSERMARERSGKKSSLKSRDSQKPVQLEFSFGDDLNPGTLTEPDERLASVK